MATHKSAQQFDVYAPAAAVPKAATVVVYLHGGAWSQPFDKDSIPDELRAALLARGAIVCSVGYQLQADRTFNISSTRRPEATFGAMLGDIDLALTKLKGVLPKLGVATVTRLVLTGESAGAHLALLYAYDQGNPAVLGLGLRHTFTVDRVIAVAAPIAFDELDGKTDVPTASYDREDFRWKLRMTLRDCLGFDETVPDATVWQGARRWSPLALVSPRAVPTMLLNGQLFPLIRTDGVIPLGQQTRLAKALEKHGVPCVTKVLMGSNHAEVVIDGADWIAAEALKETKEID